VGTKQSLGEANIEHDEVGGRADDLIKEGGNVVDRGRDAAAVLNQPGVAVLGVEDGFENTWIGDAATMRSHHHASRAANDEDSAW
jgi:hypothetical protein